MKNTQITSDKVLKRIKGKGMGCVFKARDFLDYASRNTIDKTLSRLHKQGEVRRIARGVYDYPKIHSKLGTLSPNSLKVAAAIATSENIMLQPSGAYSANMLGLTEQVPAQVVFLTDGDPKTIKIGEMVIKFKHVAPSNLIVVGSAAGLIIQAVKYLGKNAITDSVISAIQAKMSSKDKAMLCKNKEKLVAWMHPIIDKICLK